MMSDQRFIVQSTLCDSLVIVFIVDRVHLFLLYLHCRLRIKKFEVELTQVHLEFTNAAFDTVTSPLSRIIMNLLRYQVALFI